MSQPVYSGTSGRIKLAAITTTDLTTDTITFSAGTRLAQVFVMKWDLKVSGTVVKSMTLESTADAQGNLAAANVRGGSIAYSFAVQGLFSGSESIVFIPKASFVADFIVKRAASNQQGFAAVGGTIENFSLTGVDSGSNEPVKCSFDYIVSGHLPVFSTTIA